MTWLNRVKDRMNNALERVKDRIYETPERREIEREERYQERREEVRTFKLDVWEKEAVELRPFSSQYRYSRLTKTHIEVSTGRFTSKTDYKVRLKNWRLDTAAGYIARAHPSWVDADIVEALMRIEELRSSPIPDEWVDVEIGAIFSP